MNALQVKQSTDLLTIAEQAGAHFRKAGSVWQSACPLHGGDNKSAFTIFTGNDGFQHFRCFTRDECNANGSDAIAFVMTRYNCDFKDAMQMLGGEAGTTPPLPKLPKMPEKPSPVQVVPSKEWQKQAWRVVDKANVFLTDDDAGRVGREYLEGRGISRASMYVNFLGYDPQKFDGRTQTKRPAIVIPHLDTGDVITAVKYRFIDEQAKEKDHRFTQLKDGIPNLFGLQNIVPSDDVLLLVEGELNAISVYQVLPNLPLNVSVVSFGTENIKDGTIVILKQLMLRYQHTVIWMDSREKATETNKRLGGHALLFTSPVMQGRKFDANEMLKDGLLDEFLMRTMK